MLPAAFAGPAASAFPHTLQTAFRDSLGIADFGIVADEEQMILSGGR